MRIGHNMSEGDGSTDADSINGRNPSSTGMGCFKNYEHAQRNRVYSSQVLIEIAYLSNEPYYPMRIYEFTHFRFDLIVLLAPQYSYRYRIQMK